MTSHKDYYSTLGILPDAEHVVVVAAYRALASRYHPDKWEGDIDLANSRMAEINIAYGVLSDSAKRNDYDKNRQKSTGKFHAEEESQDQAFDFALHELEDKWKIAVKIYPDLEESRKRLAKTAHRLAFAFVTIILETKKFKEHRSISDRLHREFLERYFGSNPKIIAFAKDLISMGLKKAIIDLNKYVEVFGEDIDTSLVISRIKEDYDFADASTRAERERTEIRRKQSEAEQAVRRKREKAEQEARLIREAEQAKAKEAFLQEADRAFKNSIKKTRSKDKAKILMNRQGFNVIESSPWLFFGVTNFTVENKVSGEKTLFEHESAFINWVVESYCQNE